MDYIARRYGPERVQWNGWERDARGFIAGCDLLIQTSANEGTPMALIQGMAAGRPFLSTPAGGVVDLVCGPERREQNGCRWHDNGVLAPPDPTIFADAIERLFKNPALLPQMGRVGRRVAAERFQAARLIDDVDRLYRELILERMSASESNSRPNGLS